jgi:transposase
MLYVGLDLSRKRLDWHALLADGERLGAGACPPDSDGLAHLVHRLGAEQRPVLAAIESMSGARFVHDQLELAGWDVRIADAQRVKGLAPLACKTDRIDAWVLAELARRELVPEVWLPDPGVRAERERGRFRLFLVHKRTALENRVHALLFQHGLRAPVDDLFGAGGRRFLECTQLSEPWHSTLAASLHLIDVLEEQIAGLERELRRQGAEHRYVRLLMSCPGVGWVLGSTIAAEIGDIARFATAAKLVGYTGLCPRVRQSGEVDRRGALSKHGPPYLRWALVEAAHKRSARTRLPRPRRAYARSSRPETRRRDRRHHRRPLARGGDLVDAHPQRALCSGRRHDPLDRLTVPK